MALYLINFVLSNNIIYLQFLKITLKIWSRQQVHIQNRYAHLCFSQGLPLFFSHGITYTIRLWLDFSPLYLFCCCCNSMLCFELHWSSMQISCYINMVILHCVTESTMVKNFQYHHITCFIIKYIWPQNAATAPSEWMTSESCEKT